MAKAGASKQKNQGQIDVFHIVGFIWHHFAYAKTLHMASE